MTDVPVYFFTVPHSRAKDNKCRKPSQIETAFEEGIELNDNWIVEHLQSAFATWNSKLTEIWSLVTTTPQEFKGGGIWNIVVQINDALQAIGYGLLVLFFAMGLFKNTMNFQELRRPEAALRYFLHFVAAKAAVTYCMPLMLAVFDICGGIVSTVAGQMGGMAGNVGTLPGEISAAIGNVGFLASIPLWLVTILGSLFITVLSFIMIMSVYGRFFKLYLYTAIAPVPLSAFAGEPSQSVGKSFIKSYSAVCLEGAIIVLACIIFSVFAASPPVVNPDAAAVTMVWSYIGELVFNMLVLVGAVKMADRVVREMMGL